MAAVELGKVTTTSAGRYHYITNGQAKCGSGLGRILTGTLRSFTSADAPGVCRRCRDDIHAAIRAAELRKVDPTPTTARPGYVLAKVGRGTVERPIRPLSGLGRLQAAYQAAMAA